MLLKTKLNSRVVNMICFTFILNSSKFLRDEFFFLSCSRSRQSRFSGDTFKSQDQFGGSLLKKRRFRTARPVSTKLSMHLVLKSSLAKGEMSFRAKDHQKKIDQIIKRNCEKFGVRLIRFSNNFNHLHLHVKFSSRELYKRFVRAISGHIAMVVTKARKAKAISKATGRKRFWDHRPFSRIVRGWRGFKTANDYVRLNQLEAEGLMPKRGSRLRGVRPGERRYFGEGWASVRTRSSAKEDTKSFAEKLLRSSSDAGQQLGLF